MSPLPHWPAMMRRSLAARYCDLTAAQFEREVNEGRLPLPTMLGNDERWSRRRLDDALELLYGGVDDWRAKLGLKQNAA